MSNYTVTCQIAGPDGAAFRWTFETYSEDCEEAIREACATFLSGLTEIELKWANETLFIEAHPTDPAVRERFAAELRRIQRSA